MDCCYAKTSGAQVQTAEKFYLSILSVYLIFVSQKYIITMAIPFWVSQKKNSETSGLLDKQNWGLKLSNSNLVVKEWCYCRSCRTWDFGTSSRSSHCSHHSFLSSSFLVAEQLYNHSCVSVCLCVYLCVCHTFWKTAISPQHINNYSNNKTYNNNNNSQINLGNIWPVCTCTHVQI